MAGPCAVTLAYPAGNIIQTVIHTLSQNKEVVCIVPLLFSSP